MKNDGLERFEAIVRVLKKRKARGAKNRHLRKWLLSLREPETPILNKLLETMAKQKEIP